MSRLLAIGAAKQGGFSVVVGSRFLAFDKAIFSCKFEPRVRFVFPDVQFGLGGCTDSVSAYARLFRIGQHFKNALVVLYRRRCRCFVWRSV